ncbi:hypothetical protein [Roseovarius sp.]|uniref:hypothetical protein n=1 Tax=Roseovarius sp. TaxID=1486281 RepID=UPI003D0B9195
MGEIELAALLCAFLAGSVEEQRHYFDVAGMKRYVRVDCETEDHVIELSLDGSASARDSLHQALFAQHLTGKKPVVILIDRDGYEGRFEFEMRHVTQAAGVLYLRCSESAIQRWAATSGLRQGTAGADDLPGPGAVASRCDLQALRRERDAGS